MGQSFEADEADSSRETRPFCCKLSSSSVPEERGPKPEAHTDPERLPEAVSSDDQGRFGFGSEVLHVSDLVSPDRIQTFYHEFKNKSFRWWRTQDA